MPTVPIPISKGLFKNVDATTVDCTDGTRPAVASAITLKNLILDDNGNNIDRPGMLSTAFSTTGSSFGIEAMKYFEVSGTVVAVDTARRIWSITSAGVVTEITGSSLGGTSRPVMQSDGTYLAIAGGGAPQQWSGTGSTAALAGSPEDTTHISYLDGYWILPILDDQELRWAGPTAAARASWNSSNFFQAEGLPDRILATAVLLREFYAFGSDSTEIYQNFGSAATPFGRTFFIDRGIGAAYSVIQFDNTLGWLDDKRRIVRMEGRTPIEISGPIARILAGYGTVSDCWTANVEIGGYYFLVFVFPTEQTSWAYDYKRNEWYEWDGFVGGSSARLPIHSHVFVKPWNKHLIGDPYTGVIRELSFDAKTDGANVLRRLRHVRYRHGTSKRKRSNYYLVNAKQGVGEVGGTEPVLELRVNDDNKGWSDWKQVPLGNPGAKQCAKRVRMGGIYQDRELQIQMTEDAEFRLQGIEEDLDVLS